MNKSPVAPFIPPVFKSNKVSGKNHHTVNNGCGGAACGSPDGDGKPSNPGEPCKV